MVGGDSGVHDGNNMRQLILLHAQSTLEHESKNYCQPYLI